MKFKSNLKSSRRISTKKNRKNFKYIKDSQSKKEEDELKLKLKIQSNSEKMIQEKYKGEEVFSSLYNQNT